MNLRTFDKYTNIEFDLNNDNKLYSYTKIPYDKPILLVKSLLTVDECTEIIAKCANNYNSLSNEYEKTDRDCKRFLNMNSQLADNIYNRIKSIVETESIGLEPFGFGTKGKWIASRLNQCFRHSEYTGPSNGFVFHRDSCYVHDKNNRSIFSIVMYLNDDYIGGEIMFVNANKPRIIGEIVTQELSDGFELVTKLKPATGDVLIFDHDIIHCCLPIDLGTKSIIRTDILYTNIEPNDDRSYLKDPLFLQSVEYYREANNQEMKGNVKAAGLLYEKGLALRQFH